MEGNDKELKSDKVTINDDVTLELIVIVDIVIVVIAPLFKVRRRGGDSVACSGSWILKVRVRGKLEVPSMSY